MSQCTLYWHDYETFGTDPRRDRPAQFAGIRTDQELNVISDPLVIYCKPANDMLPQPEACLVTGITPQKALKEGVCEADFIKQIHQEFSNPATCVVGYNNIRFDDEVTRNALYRNFFDPYSREWKHGNSRWDIIDMVRLTRALRPEGLEWPNDKDGKPSFRLDQLTIANGIMHDAAHDALSDVYASIALARLIKQKQPRLYQYSFQQRGKLAVSGLLNIGAFSPVLHVSGKYSAKQGCIAMVVPLAQHPTNKNGVIVYNLSIDPTPLLELSSNEIRELLYVRTQDLPEGVDRMPLKIVHINKCPVIVPINTMTQENGKRLGIDLDLCYRHLERIKNALGLAAKIQETFIDQYKANDTDPDLMLYSGGFFSDSDRAVIEQIRLLSSSDLSQIKPVFQDRRLAEMLFRYRARNYPKSLAVEETERWEKYRQLRLTKAGEGGSIVYDEFKAQIAKLRQNSELIQVKRDILTDVETYGLSVVNQSI